MDGAIIAEGTPTALALDRGFSGTGAAAQELTSTMKMYHAERGKAAPVTTHTISATLLDWTRLLEY